MKFLNRTEAGALLAQELQRRNISNPYFLALPRGGVPVAAELKRLLGGEMATLHVKKVGLPFQPELALGAVTESGHEYLNEEIAGVLSLSKAELHDLFAAKREELKSENLDWKVPRKHCCGFTVVLTDDGLATGATALAASKEIREEKPDRMILAVPVAPSDSVEELRKAFDEVVVLLQPEEFHSVSQWYEEFYQVTDEQLQHHFAH